jgi:P4 family phage/plasmid primase-like protien
MVNFIERLKEYNDNKKADSKKLAININEISTFDFINSEIFQNNPVIYDDKMWWKWDNKNKCWYIIDEVEIILDFSQNFILQGITTSIFHSNIRTAILNAFKQAGLIFKKEFKKDIKPTWIVFKDCIVDVETGETFQHDFIYFATNPLPYKYQDENNKGDLSKFDRLFKDWVVGGDQDETWIETLYEIVAYCMLPDYPIEVLFCLHGDGSNGKSSFIEMLMTFIGMHNFSSTELSLLTNPNSRFETITLHKKLVCLMSELDDSTINNTSLLKKLTGNKEPIRGEYKGKGNVVFINYAKILMSTNIIPDTTDKTDGYYRRWLVVDFPNKFDATNGNVLKDITPEDYQALAKKCIPILHKLLKKSTFTNFKSILERKQRYESKANPLKKFIDDMCVINPSIDIPVFEFYEIVSSWIKDKGYRPITKPKLSRLLKEMGIESEPRHNPEVNKTWRYYIGIGLKEDNYQTIKVYNKDKNQFEEVKEFRDIEHGREYSWDDIKGIFASYSEDELSDILKSWKKQGAVTEVRSGIFRFENQKGDE